MQLSYTLANRDHFMYTFLNGDLSIDLYTTLFQRNTQIIKLIQPSFNSIIIMLILRNQYR